jgi:Glycosyltransferase family 87
MTASARTLAAAGALLVVLGILVHRAVPRINVPGKIDPARWVLQDFRDAVYYPVVAFLDGRNPYDQAAQAEAYPVGQGFPPYLPLTLVAHLPFGLVPHEEADALYAVAVLALTTVLAVLALGGAGVPVTAATTLGLTALLLASRPGQMNLLLGQVTAQVVIGAYVALRWARTWPLLAGLGLALATLKPTYGVPLAVLMLLGRGDVAAVAAGAAVSAALCLAALVPLVHAAGGVAPFVASLGDSSTAFSVEHTSNAWSSFARIDVVALAARLLGRVPESWMEVMLGVTVMAVALAALRRLRGDERAPTVQLGVGLICLTLLIATYHQAYDALLLAQPAIALGAGTWGRGVVAPRALRWTVLALLAVPAVNFLASGTMVAGLSIGGPAWLAVTVANPLALLAAWGVHLGLACRAAPR